MTDRARTAAFVSVAIPAAAYAASVVLLFWRLGSGIGFVSFMDEAAHLVGGRVLDQGGLLYRDFVDTHGPLIFAMAQGYGALFGWNHDNGARWLVAGCAVLAVLSLAASPAAALAAATGRRSAAAQARACGLLLGCGLLAAVWLRQGLYLVSFYPVGGALASIGLSGFVAGACFGRFPGRAHAIVAGVAVALLGAAAYSFGPCIAAFALAASWSACAARRWRALAGFWGGIGLGVAAAASWMRRFADAHGYLSYHVAENQLVYSRYIGFGWWMFRHGLVPSALPGERARTVGLACLLLSLGGLLLPGVRRGPLLLAVAGVLSLNARGADDFQNGSFLWAAITLSALVAMRAAASIPDRARWQATTVCAVLVLSASWFLQGATYQPFGWTARHMASEPRWPIGDRSDAPFFSAIRRYAHPGEPILGLVYQPQLYLLADRPPMDGFYAWFPWDADYARSARFGRGRDLCIALRDQPPPVIVLDPAPLWGYAPSGIAPCLPAILRDLYRAETSVSDLHGVLYVRRDRAAPA